MKNNHRLCFFVVLLIAGTSAQAMENCHNEHNVCSAIFYDFERTDEPLIEYWEQKENIFENWYRCRRPEHFGAMLTSHGFYALPLGYGKFEVIKDGKMLHEYRCEGCNTLYVLEGCAFSNCFYQIKGQKSNGFTVKSPWKKVEDFLHVFSDKKKFDQYHRMIIECKHLWDTPPDEDPF